MKAIIGASSEGYTQETLRLLRRLSFEDLSIEIANVVDELMPIYSEQFAAAGVGAALLSERRQFGECLLAASSGLAKSYGMRSETSQAYGPVSTTLMDLATDSLADLLVVRAALHGPLESVVYGSVSRSLAINAKQSLLVLKGGHWLSGPVRAIFATDHSPYNERALTRFLEMRPRGLEKVLVVSAYEVNDEEACVLHTNLPMLGGQVDTWVHERLEQKTEQIADRFRRAGIPAESLVEEGHANDVLRNAMNEWGGELMMVGAQGHRWIERLLVGSVSLHQVAGEAYSTLLLRA